MQPDPAPSRHWEADTLPLTRSLTDTLELPVIAQPTPPPAPQPRPAPASSRRRRRLAGLCVALVLLLGTAVAVGVRLTSTGSDAGSGAASSAVAIRSVSSLDPAGGSGLRRTGSSPSDAVWRTQHYRSAEFGGLKPGVGLLIDLGTPRELDSIRTVVGVPGTSVELRAGDSTSAPDGFRTVDRAGSARGSTSLDATDGGKHRYWLIWVPRLGRDGNGYAAELRGISVRG